MRTVPAELADLIPLDAHTEVASVVEELMVSFPDAMIGPPQIGLWMWALSIWNARWMVASPHFRLLHMPHPFADEDIIPPVPVGALGIACGDIDKGDGVVVCECGSKRSHHRRCGYVR